MSAAEFGKSLARAYTTVTVLQDLSDWYFMVVASKEFKDYQLSRFPSESSYCSMCSGSGMESDVMEMVVKSLDKLGVQISHRNLFMAKIIHDKQQLLMRTRCGVKPGGLVNSYGPCLFTDVTKIHCTGPCVAHHRGGPWPANKATYVVAVR